MKKRIILLLVALSLYAGLCFESYAYTFTDVRAGHWAYQPIQKMADRGVIQGVGDNIFAPNDNVTGAEFITMLIRAFYNDDTITAQQNTSSNWSAPYINLANSLNLLNGVTANNNAMNRADMAEVIYNFLVQKDITIPGDNEIQKVIIPDIGTLSTEQQKCIKVVYSLGHLKGIDETGNFKGQNNMTRAEAATVLNRLIDAYPQSNVPPIDNKSDTPKELSVSVSTSKSASIAGSVYNISYSLSANGSGGAGDYTYKFEILQNDEVTKSTDWGKENSISGSLRGNGSCIIRVSIQDSNGDIVEKDVDMLETSKFGGRKY